MNYRWQIWRTPKAIWLFVTLLFCAPSWLMADVTSSGLTLELELAREDNTTDSIKARVTLRNLSARPITLTANWSYEHETGDYIEYFRSAVGMKTEPPTYIMTQQTAGSMRQSSQPRHSLSPGEAITTEWSETCGRLKPRDVLCCKAPQLHEPGIYTVQAMFCPGPGFASVESKPVQLNFGRSIGQPVHTSARVTAVDYHSSTVLLNAGNWAGLRAGQRFRTPTSTVTGFDFEIVSVHPEISEAKFSEFGPAHWPSQSAGRLTTGATVWRADTMFPPACEREAAETAPDRVNWKARLLPASVFALFFVLCLLQLRKYTRSPSTEQLP